jgi:hypothetical protein
MFYNQHVPDSSGTSNEENEMGTVDQIIDYENGEMDQGQEAEMMQGLINAGQWGLQGSYGRAMMAAIENGECMLGHKQARDYYGNPIPGRDDVEAGTKGHYDYVAERMGAEYADKMAAIK